MMIVTDEDEREEQKWRGSKKTKKKSWKSIKKLPLPCWHDVNSDNRIPVNVNTEGYSYFSRNCDIHLPLASPLVFFLVCHKMCRLPWALPQAPRFVYCFQQPEHNRDKPMRTHASSLPNWKGNKSLQALSHSCTFFFPLKQMYSVVPTLSSSLPQQRNTKYFCTDNSWRSVPWNTTQARPCQAETLIRQDLTSALMRIWTRVRSCETFSRNCMSASWRR